MIILTNPHSPAHVKAIGQITKSNDEFFVQFERIAGQHFQVKGARVIDEWAATLNLDDEDYFVRPQHVSFFDEHHAKLCYERFR